MLLHPASLSSTALKAAFFGTGGSGKTLTAMLLAIGIAKERHASAPIAFVDPEGVEEFIAPICAAESVPLVVLRGRTFVEMRDGLTEAEQLGCCAYVVDHYDGIFRELTEAQKLKLNLIGRKLPYAHREELIRVWDMWVRQFRSSPLACIFTGRLAWEWGDSESEDGETEKVKLGTKMRGDSDAGYEPNLLVEMERVEKFTRDKISKRKRGEIEHVARVLKDRRMVLNGRSFAWKDLNAYQQGDYRAVYNSLAPHLGDASSNAAAVRVSRDLPSTVASSAGLFEAVSGESAYAERLKRITVACEDFQSTLQVLWPGTTQIAKACHAAAIEAIFHTRSWSAVESKTVEAVETGAALLRACESALPREADGVAPTTRPEVLAWIASIQTAQKAETVL